MTPTFYSLSLHDALPISAEELDVRVAPDHHARVQAVEHGVQLLGWRRGQDHVVERARRAVEEERVEPVDRKSTRLNSSHTVISYAVFCLKKKIRAILIR